MYSVETYRNKYGIDFSDLSPTNRYEQRLKKANGYPYLYEASPSSLVLTSLPDPDFDDEPRYIMSAVVNSPTVLTPTLITKTGNNDYYPIFHANAFIDIALLYFGDTIHQIKLDYYNSRYIHEMYDQFFRLFNGSCKQDPEMSLRNTTIAKRFVKNGFVKVTPEKTNDYYSQIDGEVLTFWLSK